MESRVPYPEKPLPREDVLRLLAAAGDHDVPHRAGRLFALVCERDLEDRLLRPSEVVAEVAADVVLPAADGDRDRAPAV